MEFCKLIVRKGFSVYVIHLFIRFANTKRFYTCYSCWFNSFQNICITVLHKFNIWAINQRTHTHTHTQLFLNRYSSEHNPANRRCEYLSKSATKPWYSRSVLTAKSRNPTIHLCKPCTFPAEISCLVKSIIPSVLFAFFFSAEFIFRS